MKIKFSHHYPKLHAQKSAKLLAVEKCILSKLSAKFLEYDTVFDSGNYYLAPGVYMILVFIGDEFIPFTTVRRFTEEKFRYYHSSIGNHFDIVNVAAEGSGTEPVQPTTAPCCEGEAPHAETGTSA